MTVPVTGETASAPGGASGSQSNRNVYSNAPMTTRKMPKPGEKNAPIFDPEKPEELGRFFERMEDWFADEAIEKDLDKKRRIVKYLDADSEIQWKALSTFLEGTFEDFKAEVMASYPKAEEVMKGSVNALKKKIKKLGPIATDDRDELLSLVRIMTAEVLKLKNISPPIHTNRELVELFLSRLTPDFAARVANKLSVHRLWLTAQPPGADTPVRNTEDMYDIEEVMQMAKHTSLEHANPFSKYLHGVPGTAAETNVKLEEAVARLTDTINLQVQHNKQVDQRLANMQSYMNQPRLPAAMPAAQQGFNRGLAPPQNHVAPIGGLSCFYCKGGHRIGDCEHVHKHLDLGWIKRIDGFMRLPDGQRIPRDGMKSMKEVVEALNHLKPGIIPMSKIQDKAGLYQNEAKMTSYIQAHAATDEENIRALTELIQKVGLDKVQKLLSTSTVLEEEGELDEWGQNFD